MKKPKERPTAKEILRILDGMWVDKKGIMQIAFCGDNKACGFMQDIRKNVKKKYEKECPRDLVPTDEVIRFFNINVSYLKKISSNLERKIENEKETN